MQIAEKLEWFPLNSAKCKKVYDKYFKKGTSSDSLLVETTDCRRSSDREVRST